MSHPKPHSEQEVFWSFFNDITGLQVDGLSFDQAKVFFAIINLDDQLNWFGWHEGLQDWKPISQIKSLSAPGASKRTPPFPPQKMTMAAQGNLQAQTTAAKKSPIAKLAEENNQEVDQRLSKRFLKDYAVEIKVEGRKTFKTRTINISMGGMLLQDLAPDDLPKSFEVILTRSNGDSLSLFCTTIKLPHADHKLNRLRITGNVHEGKLRKWLLDAVTT